MRIVAAALAGLEIVLIAAAAMMAMMSVMMFDAPGSEQNSALWVAMFSLWALPFALAIGAGFEVWAAISYRQGRFIAGLVIPAVPVVVLVIAFMTSGF